MSVSTNQTFACPQCGKRFTWKPQYAGRKVSCGCGRVFEATRGFEGAQMQGDSYDVAVDEPPVVVPAAVARASAPALAQARPTSIASVYPQRKRAMPVRVETDDDANLDPEAASPFINIYFPWGLLILGAGAQLGWSIHAARGSMAGAIGLVLIKIHLAAIVTLGAAFVAASLLGVTFGTIKRASVKLAAIAVFCDSAAAIAASIDKEPGGIRGLVLGMHLSLLLCFALLYTLFDLDVQESLTTVVIIWVCQWILAAALISVMGHGA
jgi:hypothetical protein